MTMDVERGVINHVLDVWMIVMFTICSSYRLLSKNVYVPAVPPLDASLLYKPLSSGWTSVQFREKLHRMPVLDMPWSFGETSLSCTEGKG